MMNGSGSEPSVLREFERYPEAIWVKRTRTVSRGAFESAARRVRLGLKFGVAARIEDSRGRILLVRMTETEGWTKAWTLPGGGGEPGEAPREAVVREIKEETGVNVNDLRLWKNYHETVRDPSGRSIRWDFLQYTARWASGRPRSLVPEEICEVRWFRRLPQNTEFRRDWVRPPRDRFRALPKRGY
jgi:ADP-ribose pyrophosphatase YjhB (NUDIX family)